MTPAPLPANIQQRCDNCYHHKVSKTCTIYRISYGGRYDHWHCKHWQWDEDMSGFPKDLLETFARAPGYAGQAKKELDARYPGWCKP